MKIKNTRTSKASKLKSAVKTVIRQITAVRIPDKFTGSDGPSALGFLKDAGFRIARTPADKDKDGCHDKGYISAVTPGGDMAFYLECKLKNGKCVHSSEFCIIRVHRGTTFKVDAGSIQSVVSPASDGAILFIAKGDEVDDWEITALSEILEKIPKQEFFFAEDSLAIQGDNGEANGHAVPIPARREGELISTSDVMIADMLKNRAELAENPEARKAHSRSLSVLTPPLSSVESQPKLEKLPNRWPFNPPLREYMAESRGNEQSVAAISDALHELSKNESPGDLALRFDDYQMTITTLLSVQKLDLSLKPLLDRPCRDPERITPDMLKWLVHFPMAEQVKAWEDAKAWGEQNKDRMSSLILAKLEELAKPYYVRQKRRNYVTSLMVEQKQAAP